MAPGGAAALTRRVWPGPGLVQCAKAERRLKECEEQARQFTKPVRAYRGES
jgi:hypothetical protein